jgi:single-strand DNA-binding protein
MARSLNVIHLIGNLTRDPELRYTGSGRAICVFGLATNRSWKTEAGETREESSYHRIVAWERLAEQCAQLLVKGRKVYVQGRLAYRTYQKDDEEREVAEIVIDDMLLLDSKGL